MKDLKMTSLSDRKLKDIKGGDTYASCDCACNCNSSMCDCDLFGGTYAQLGVTSNIHNLSVWTQRSNTFSEHYVPSKPPSGL